MYEDLFVVDVEATAPTPMTGVMPCFGAVHVVSGRTFYGHLYRWRHDHAGLPVLEFGAGGAPIAEPYWAVDGQDAPRAEHSGDVAAALQAWVGGFEVARPTLVSDNNGFDAMWLNCFTDGAGLGLLFGHSSRRIGDFFAGTRGRWADQSSWKSLRRTAHTHHPVDDAIGNAEALRVILGIG
ncbi:hypothetical protein ACAG26_09555 [Mycobacterium sp. pUA109]|uniref:hypothetical protein n=1 Tax=Mycobacterium sp. pUA109 TaxID=3238982 RepID=UPI00351B89BC